MSIYWGDLLFLLLAYFPVVLVHELGHVAAGWATGARGAHIRFGDPRARRRTALGMGPLRIEWHWGLGLWSTGARFWFTHADPAPWKRLVRILGGPAASALLLLLLLPDGAGEFVWWWRPGLTARQSVQFLALWLTVVGLVPFHHVDGMPSDRLQIITLTRELWRSRRSRAA